jgi:hypothetical protein
MSELTTIPKQINEDILQRAGYKNLGWSNEWNKIAPEEYIRHGTSSQCLTSEISYSEAKNLCYCDECKIYWFYDCSD